MRRLRYGRAVRWIQETPLSPKQEAGAAAGSNPHTARKVRVVIGELRTMARPRLEEALGWIGLRVDDVYGFEIGEVAAVLTEPADGRSPLARRRRGAVRARSLVPFDDASGGPENVWVPYDRRTVREAPRIGPAEELGDVLNARLESHYAAARDHAVAPVGRPHRRPYAEPTHRMG